MSEEQFVEKMNDVLKNLEDANKESDKFKSSNVGGEGIPKIYDFYEMALALDTEEYWMNEYKILLTLMYPEKVPWRLDLLEEIKLKLENNIKSWKTREMIHED